MLSKKTVKDIGEFVAGSRRKPEATKEEKARMMLVRDVFHASARGENVCVVLPDGVSLEQAFDGYMVSMKNRMKKPNVVITTLGGLTVEHIESNLIVDMTGIMVAA